jgi:hypothetical protein
MAVYTVVDEGYDVIVCKSLDALCDEVLGRANAGQTLFIGREYEGVKANFRSLKTHLRNSGNCVMWVYREGESDWAFKVQRHK